MEVCLFKTVNSFQKREHHHPTESYNVGGGAEDDKHPYGSAQTQEGKMGGPAFLR